MAEASTNPLIASVHGGVWYAHFYERPEVKGHGYTRKEALECLRKMLKGELCDADKQKLNAEIREA